ncbi:hypothetical protein [Nitrobacter winogradskyi]|uniref:hypothetical protein n=1 Tax=Nitrobacter winogradskyi TaxID=913 RepID=UPI001650721E|nr:hypothetical protein [Nitrobacter winogradskyi]
MSQTALFAGFGIANLEIINLTRLLFCVIIAVIGATTATLTLLAIEAAHSEIRSLVKSYGNIETADYRGKLPIIGSGLHHKYGHMLCTGLPWLMAPFWILAGLYVSLKYCGMVF